MSNWKRPCIPLHFYERALHASNQLIALFPAAAWERWLFRLPCQMETVSSSWGKIIGNKERLLEDDKEWIKEEKHWEEERERDWRKKDNEFRGKTGQEMPLTWNRIFFFTIIKFWFIGGKKCPPPPRQGGGKSMERLGVMIYGDLCGLEVEARGSRWIADQFEIWWILGLSGYN